jgi:hypothetical protein
MSKEPAKAGKKGKAPTESKKKKVVNVSSPAPRLPILVEMTYAVPTLLILVVDMAVIGFSYSAGADWVAILVRACVTTLVLGSLALLVVHFVSSESLAAARAMRRAAEAAARQPDSDSVKA